MGKLEIVSSRRRAKAIEVTWDALKEENIKYVVEMKGPGAEAWEQVYDGDATTYDKEGLKPEEAYTFRVGIKKDDDAVEYGPDYEAKTVAVPIGCGLEEETYKWTQTIDDVDIQITLPIKVKGRDVICDIAKQKISVGLKGHDKILEGELANEVRTDESTWSLEDGKELSIHLEKRHKGGFWTRLVDGAREIDCNMIEPPTVGMETLDPEAQQLVSKMKYDQWAKATGNKTSQEIQNQSMLEKLQGEHPEFDFSKASITGPGAANMMNFNPPN
eukprot:GFYU01016638.1.p1 GENE.GFYU01016638.1~~GFYU01016638.1.p1  ORF type:complete len:273 (-),score=79.66 GFYU01016638.1:76-894(-)